MFIEFVWEWFVYLCSYCAKKKNVSLVRSLVLKNVTKNIGDRFTTSCGWLFCVCVAIFVTHTLSVKPCKSSESVHEVPQACSDQPTRLVVVQTVYSSDCIYGKISSDNMCSYVSEICCFSVHGTCYKLKRWSRSVRSFDHKDSALDGYPRILTVGRVLKIFQRRKLMGKVTQLIWQV